jgi:hypothetical protein
MRHIDSHLYWRDYGAAAVQAHRDRAAVERERQKMPHPLVRGPLGRIPIPERQAAVSSRSRSWWESRGCT